jgi:hypothetical protein
MLHPEDFKETAEYAWLRQQANAFAFHESWLEGNDYGMRAEPWHWQYLGAGRLRRSQRICAGTGRLADGVEHGEDLGRAQPHDELTWHAVAAAELLRTLGPHISGRDRCRGPQQLDRILRELCHPLDLDEPVGRLLEVDADRGARVAGERVPLRGVLAGVEDQRSILDDEPHRDDQRTPVGGAVTELASPCPFQQEVTDLTVGQGSHTGSLTRSGVHDHSAVPLVTRARGGNQAI